MVAALYNVNSKRGSKRLSPGDCALQFRRPVQAVPPKDDAATFRRKFDSYKEMVIAIASQGGR